MSAIIENTAPCYLIQQIDADLQFVISFFPPTVNTTDSFFVKSIVTAKNIKVHEICGSRERSEESANNGELAKEFLERAKVKFVLAIAGAEVRPDVQILSPDDQLIWSVKAQKEGTLRGLIAIEPPDSSPERNPPERNPRDQWPVTYIAHPASASSFEIGVVDDLFTRERLISYAVSFLGALLTLPGIFNFVQDRRKGLSESKKESSRIILP